MKKLSVFVLFGLCCMLFVYAGAVPAVTDGTTSAWIDENGFPDLQTEDGTILQLPTAVDDLLMIRRNWMAFMET